MEEVVYGADLDDDGDFDYFDAAIFDHWQRDDVGSEQWQHVLTQINGDNAIWEFFEDVTELFDGNPNNNSFNDGGNGSGNETPIVQSFWPPGSGPGGGVPVVLTFDGLTYSFLNGNFTVIGNGGFGGGGGDGTLGV